MCYVMVLWQLTCACVNLQHLQTKSNYPCTPPQIWYNYISYTHPSPPPLCLGIGLIVCIAILSHDVKVYLSPYQITVEGIVRIHLHSFEWCTLTRIHNMVYFLITRTHTQNRVIFVVPYPLPDSLLGIRLDCVCGLLPSLFTPSLPPLSLSPSLLSFLLLLVSISTIGYRAFTYLCIGF